jgi:hypothetical protein
MSGLQMKYFVLKPSGDSLHAQACRAAMKVYAAVIEFENKELAEDIREWVKREES